MTRAPAIGDLRDGGTAVEVFTGETWVCYMPLPPGMSYREAAIRLCAPLDFTEDEIQHQLEMSR